ncbi:hypothetical protein IIC45_01410 [Patescibacteria group bacterium]|nr:hypothetical protein [Patescibacteria group bacterium]
MTQSAGTYIRVLLALALVGSIIWYAYRKSADFLEGPTIIIHTPENGITVTHSLVEIKGTAEHIAHISINGRKIFVTEEGLFSEQLLLSLGYNIITLEARDRFDREVKKSLELVYK